MGISLDVLLHFNSIRGFLQQQPLAFMCPFEWGLKTHRLSGACVGVWIGLCEGVGLGGLMCYSWCSLTAGSQAASEPEGGIFSGLTCAWLVAHRGGIHRGGILWARLEPRPCTGVNSIQFGKLKMRIIRHIHTYMLTRNHRDANTHTHTHTHATMHTYTHTHTHPHTHIHLTLDMLCSVKIHAVFDPLTKACWGVTDYI